MQRVHHKTVLLEQAAVYEKLIGKEIHGIVTVYSVQPVPDNPLYVEVEEQWIDGICLKEYMQKGMTIAQILSVAIQLADSLQQLEALGIVHRDISPANIMFQNDELILIDFGNSRVWDKTKTKDTIQMGTKGYAAPEQYGFSQSDHRTDLYSAGAVLSQLIMERMHDKKMSIDYEGWMLLELERITEKLMQISPENRYQNAIQLKDDLLRINESNYKKTKIKSTTIHICGVLGVISCLAICLVFGYKYFSEWKARQSIPKDIRNEVLQLQKDSFSYCDQKISLWYPDSLYVVDTENSDFLEETFASRSDDDTMMIELVVNDKFNVNCKDIASILDDKMKDKSDIFYEINNISDNTAYRFGNMKVNDSTWYIYLNAKREKGNVVAMLGFFRSNHPVKERKLYDYIVDKIGIENEKNRIDQK